MDYINPEEMTVENIEIKELAEQFESTDEIDKVIDFYRSSSLEALADGNKDMHEYYKSKKAELMEVRQELVKVEAKQWHEEFSKRMDESIAESEELLAEIKMDKAVHGFPRYGGRLEWTEDEWKYEAAKELQKNGETPRYRELIRKAAEARVDAELDKIKKY